MGEQQKQLSETLQARIWDNAGPLQMTIQDLREWVNAYLRADWKRYEELAAQIVDRWATEKGKRELMLLADSLKTLYNSQSDSEYWRRLNERDQERQG